jgi:hypothetical protein
LDHTDGSLSKANTRGVRGMSKEVEALVESYSDLLIQVLNIKDSNALLSKVLSDIDETQRCIDKGLLK